MGKEVTVRDAIEAIGYNKSKADSLYTAITELTLENSFGDNEGNYTDAIKLIEAKYKQYRDRQLELEKLQFQIKS